MAWRGLPAALIAVLLAGPAAGQTPQLEIPPPVLTIDAERILDESAFGRNLSAEFEARARALAAENREIEQMLLSEERDLTERRPELPPDEFRALADAFDEKVQRLRAQQDEKERELAGFRENERQRLLGEIVPILSEIVRERRALVILDRRDVFLSADSIDITDEAIRRIDAAQASDGEGAGEAAPGNE